MKRFNFIVITCSLFICFLSKGQNRDSIRGNNLAESISGIYEYTYENNTEDLVENHYIFLIDIDGIILGQYFGTSDDFDIAREGYLPGFFKTDMQNMKITDSTIYFKLILKPSDLYKEAITPYKNPKRNKHWCYPLQFTEREYCGEIYDDKIVITSKDFGNRVFVKRK